MGLGTLLGPLCLVSESQVLLHVSSHRSLRIQFTRHYSGVTPTDLGWGGGICFSWIHH